MLKQSIFFKKLEKKNLTVSKYHILYQLYGRKHLLCNTMKKIKRHEDLLIYLNKDCTLNEKGERLVKSLDSYFKPIKQLNTIELLGDNYKENIEQFLDIFPKGKLPNGKYARGNKQSIESNFMWFFQEYDYEWDTILKATQKYVDEYYQDNYKFMRTAMYYIKKLIDGTVQSELATYCQAYLDGDDDEKVVFKKKVV